MKIEENKVRKMLVNLRTEALIDTAENQVLNRSFRYGDGIFETIKISFGALVHEALHLSRILEGMSVLQLQLDFMVANEQFLSNIYNKLVAEGAGPSGTLRIYVFRGGGGRYLPEANTAEIYAQFTASESTLFQLPNEGLKLGTYKDISLHYSKTSKLKTCNAIPYTLAALFAQSKGFDEVLLLDREGFVAECISSNLILWRKGELRTPSLYQGGVEGVMMRRIESLSKDMNIDMHRSYLTLKDVEEADAIFLSNAINGIKWVSQFNSNTYGPGNGQDIVDKLNEHLQPLV